MPKRGCNPEGRRKPNPVSRWFRLTERDIRGDGHSLSSHLRLFTIYPAWGLSCGPRSSVFGLIGLYATAVLFRGPRPHRSCSAFFPGLQVESGVQFNALSRRSDGEPLDPPHTPSSSVRHQQRSFNLESAPSKSSAKRASKNCRRNIVHFNSARATGSTSLSPRDRERELWPPRACR